MVVVYPEDEVDNYIALADAIEDAFPELQVEGEEAAGPVHIRAEDGSVLHGEVSEGAWPDAQAVIAALKKAGI